MASANVDLVRSVADAWNRGDLEVMLELLSPRFELHSARTFPDFEAVYYGREGYAEFWHSFREAWADFTLDVRRVEDLGEERVLVLLMLDGRGRGSGVEVSLRYGYIWTISDGVATRVQGFASWDEALAAAGMPAVSANVTLVRSFGAAWERGDFAGMAERVHPTVEFLTDDGPDAGVVIGLERVERGWREYLSMWEDYRWAVEEVRELAGERVLVLGHLTGRAETSGLDLGELPHGVAAVFHVHDDKITKIVRYWDRARALADLGLGPEADSPVLSPPLVETDQ